MKIVHDNLKTVRDRQRSYVDNRCRDLQFEIGDRVFLKTSPWKGVLRFLRRGKFSPRFIGPYEIVSKVGPVAYRLKLPSELSRIHDTFHVSMLRKYIPDPSHMIREQPMQLKENLTYEETPVQIIDRKEQVLRSNCGRIMRERQLPRSQRLRCVVSILNYFRIEVFSFSLSLVCSFRGRNFLKEGGFVTPHPERVYGTCNRKVSYVHQGLP